MHDNDDYKQNKTVNFIETLRNNKLSNLKKYTYFKYIFEHNFMLKCRTIPRFYTDKIQKKRPNL